MKALPGWLNRLVPAVSPGRFVFGLTGCLLAVHVSLGVLCYRGILDYYVWGRPNLLFWLFYFFSGLHYRTLTASISPHSLKIIGRTAFAIAVIAMIWNGLHATDRAVVGEHFERNGLDYAYVRPEMLIYDLAMVLGLAAGVNLGWNPRAGIFSYLGRYTLEIYLWHILVLYYGAWRHADALAACRQLPELIVVICAAAALAIAGATDGWSRLKFFRHHRLVLVQVP